MSNRATVPAVLSVHELECYRGDNLLFSALSFALSPGQCMQIEGANGSGKTSLLRILAGLSRPSDGEVRWRGADIQSQRAVYFSEMVYLGHLLGLKADLSAIENLKIALALAGVPFDENTIYHALDNTGLQGREEVPARSLSAGQKQRIALARMLVSPAVLWIMDEPFTALDVTGVALVCRLLGQHLEQGGMAVLTSHQAVDIRGDVVKVSLA